MSAAAGPVVGKILTGAVVGKAVGKVTGKNKLGVLAAIGVGMANPLGFGAAEGGEALTAGDKLLNKATGEGGLLSKGLDKVSAADDWMKAHPGSSKLLLGGAKGAADQYMGNKEADAAMKMKKMELDNQVKLQQMKEVEESRDYQRKHQGFNATEPGMMAPAPGLLNKSSAADQYFKEYSQMYGPGVR